MPLFNTLLREAGIDPTRTQLVRHRDSRLRTKLSPYILWRTAPPELETYQSIQITSLFDVPGVLASFVVPPSGETLFVGLYETVSVSQNAETVTCPASLIRYGPGSVYVYAFQALDALFDLTGRLVIDWGPGARSWVQRAKRQDKPVLEIRRRFEEPPFPDFGKFQASTRDLAALPHSWRAILTATKGVYLLVSEVNGEQYVGSATGPGGFLSRWEAYARDGHGGNQLLLQRGKPPYLISILDTAAFSAAPDNVIAIEQAWKQRLGTRAFGLNGN
jgi:hypothetical protein